MFGGSASVVTSPASVNDPEFALKVSPIELMPIWKATAP